MERDQDAEYSALRQEILQKQAQSVSVFAGSIAAIGVLVGLAGKQGSDLEGPGLLPTVLALTLISVSCFVVYGLIASHTVIGAYLSIWHGHQQWELAVTQYRKRHYYLTPSRSMAVSYLLVSVLFVGWYLYGPLVGHFTGPLWQIGLAILLGMLTWWRIWCLYRIPANQQARMARWQSVLDSMVAETSETHAPVAPPGPGIAD